MSVRKQHRTTGTDIANEIQELYKQFSDKDVDFKNVQRRVYDALNVLDAMDIIKKDKNQIYYNEDNEFIDDTVQPSTKPDLAPTMYSESDNYMSQNPNSINFSQNILQNSTPSPKVIDQQQKKKELVRKRLAKLRQKKQELQEKLTAKQNLLDSRQQMIDNQE